MPARSRGPLDLVRGILAEGQDCEPPDIRTALLRLHGLALNVVNKGMTSNAEEFFETAQDIELHLSDMIEALQSIQRALQKLDSLNPGNLAV